MAGVSSGDCPDDAVQNTFHPDFGKGQAQV